MRDLHPARRVDLVLVGAEGVVENGGVINKLGTYQIALAAAAHNTPFYVAAESYKVRSRRICMSPHKDRSCAGGRRS